jgi:hypothetical protein
MKENLNKVSYHIEERIERGDYADYHPHDVHFEEEEVKEDNHIIQQHPNFVMGKRSTRKSSLFNHFDVNQITEDAISNCNSSIMRDVQMDTIAPHINHTAPQNDFGFKTPIRKGSWGCNNAADHLDHHANMNITAG